MSSFATEQEKLLDTDIFAGNIYIFHAFDIGDEINLEKVKESSVVMPRPLTLPKYFKNYHIPLAVELPHPHSSSMCVSTKMYNFGAVSLTYQIPFEDTLKNLREKLSSIDNKFQEHSIIDVGSLFKKVKPYITKPQFFHTKSSYVVIQLDKVHPKIDISKFKEQYGGVIASTLRFETQTLSENQKNEILESTMGYFKGDLMVIDTEAAFIYESEYEDILDLFEFANIQHLELRYFDRLLDQQMNIMYEERSFKVPLKAYLPMIGTLSTNPIDDMGKLRVDISVITERLESSIKLVGEPYLSELYAMLVDKLDLKNWKDGIDKKLSIIQDIRSVLQHKVDGIRGDILTLLIIVLIFTELVVALMHH
jgi:hypothetical protein